MFVGEHDPVVTFSALPRLAATNRSIFQSTALSCRIPRKSNNCVHTCCAFQIAVETVTASLNGPMKRLPRCVAFRLDSRAVSLWCWHLRAAFSELCVALLQLKSHVKILFMTIRRAITGHLCLVPAAIINRHAGHRCRFCDGRCVKFAGLVPLDLHRSIERLSLCVPGLHPRPQSNNLFGLLGCSFATCPGIVPCDPAVPRKSHSLHFVYACSCRLRSATRVNGLSQLLHSRRVRRHDDSALLERNV